VLPERFAFDRRLPDEETVRATLEERAITPFGPGEDLDRLHRVLYPAFRLTFEYEASELLSLGENRETTTTLVDGLVEGNDRFVHEYVDGTADPVTADPAEFDLGTDHPGLGTTVLLSFQATNDRAESVLVERLLDYRERRATAGEEAAAVFLDKFKETYGLPEDFDPDGGMDVTDVSRVYLPFWLAEFRAESADHAYIVSFRDTEDADVDHPDGWVAEWVSGDPTVVGDFGYEVDLDRIQRGASDGTGSRDTGSESAAGGHGVEGAETNHEGGPEPLDPPGDSGERAGAEGTTEVVQPDGVELNADSLVDPAPDHGFGEVGGMAELKETLRHKVIRPVTDPDRFAEYGLSVVNGVLLHGPPGCGKTYVTRALAGELGHAFVEVSPADVTSKYMGEPAQKVADVFEIARANAPCLLCIDEIDGIAGDRDGESDMNSSEQQLVNQLLTELESLDDHDVVVVGATNLLEDVDPAIRRSGRFDERVEVPPPGADARRAILDLHLAGRPTADGLDPSPVVERTVGYAASDLELIAENAAREALREEAPIGRGHLEAALESTESSIADWVGVSHKAGTHVVQPDGVDLSAHSLVTVDVDLSFDDVGGMDDLKSRLRETVLDPLSNPETYDRYDIDVLSGLLLYGPPGCGKTHVTRALAGELDHAFVEVSPADLTSKWMGKPEQNVADLFEIARANAPCLLFVDEIDAVAGSRGGLNQGGQGMVNQLLTELESLEEDDVVAVGATNLLEDVDGAIRRSGRFDERVEVPPPDADARRAILELHLGERPVADAVDWARIVEGTEGYAASDLELLAENAARNALRADEAIDDDHLETALFETQSSLRNWDDGDRDAGGGAGPDPRFSG
jgi:SpoVK/Ycf46/Vps4 family AAA+-type ATPase